MNKLKIKQKATITKPRRTTDTDTGAGIELTVISADDRSKYRVSSYTYLLP